jgi:hypothetical protein
MNRRSAIFIVDGKPCSVNGAYTKALAAGFNGSRNAIYDRLSRGMQTTAQLAAPVTTTNGDHAKRTAASRSECLAAQNEVDARRRAIAMASVEVGEDE